LSADSFIALLDKGYHNGRELEVCQKEDIITIVAPPTIVNSNEHGTTAEYIVSNFVYNNESDTYTCPAGSTLKTSGTWHKKSRERDSYQFKKYRTPDCKVCPVKHLCTGRAKGGREIERSQYAEAVAINGANYRANPELYRKRQEINEHIFGTIKRHGPTFLWGYNHTNLRGLAKVNGEMALIMTDYNMKLAINIMGIEKLKTLKPDYPKATIFSSIRSILRRFNEPYFFDFASRAA